MDTHLFHNHHQHDSHNGLLASLFPSSMQQDHIHQQQGPQSIPFHPPSSPSSNSQSTNPSLSPMSNLQSQLTMNMLNNMMQIQNVGDQLVGMAGQQMQGAGASNMQYNAQAMFVEQQFKLSQLQQLQQLQNQIFQQQIALISGQSFLATSPSLNRPDILSNGLPLSPLKDQSSSSSSPHSSAVSSFTGLPTPGPSSELRPRGDAIEFVPPMILNANPFLESPISPQSTHHPNDHPFSHSQQQPSSHAHSQHYSASHAHTAPPQIAFHIQSTIPSHPTSPVFGDNNAPPSSTLSSVSTMTDTGPELDVEISPLTSPWLGAAGNQHHQQAQGGHDSGLNLQHARSTGFSHHNGAPSSLRPKRPAEGNSGNDENGQSISGNTSGSTFESSEPLRKKHALNSPSTMRGGLNHPLQHHNHSHSTPLTHLPQASNTSPLISPTSPLSVELNSAGGVAGTGSNPSSSSSSAPSNAASGPGTSSQRRPGYRGSKSVSNTPIMRGQRSRAGTTRTQANSNSNSGVMGLTLPPHTMGSGGNASVTSTPSTSTIGTGTGFSMVGVAVGDTPSPVDLDQSMPPPAPPDQRRSSLGGNGGSNTNNSGSNSGSGSGSGSGVGSSPNLAPGMNNDVAGIGFGGMPLLPATPASIMRLTKLNNTGSSTAGNFGHGHSQGGVPTLGMPQPPQGPDAAGSVGKDKKGREMEKERSEKGSAVGDKEKDRNEKGKGGTGMGGVATSIAAGRTRRNTAGGAGVSPGLKAILPASALDPNSFPHASTSKNDSQNQAQAPRKTSHKAAEQKRRDSLKSTFDDLRTLLPPIPLPSDVDDGGTGGGVIPGVPGAWPPRSFAQLPGSLPPRGPPKTGAEGPNKGVSKLQLLICGNEYIRVLKARVERRDDEIRRLRKEVGKLRGLVRELKLSGGESRDGGSAAVGEGRNGDGDVEMLDGDLGFDLDLDLERDLDAVELHGRDGSGGEKGVDTGNGGVSIGTGAASVGASVSVLGSLGEQPEEDDGD